MSSGSNNNRGQPVDNRRTSSPRVGSRSKSPPTASPQINVQGATSRARSAGRGILPPRKRYKTSSGAIPAEIEGNSSQQEAGQRAGNADPLDFAQILLSLGGPAPRSSAAGGDSSRPHFICPHCSSVFFSETSVRNHLQIHAGGNLRQGCWVCTSWFGTAQELGSHISAQHQAVHDNGISALRVYANKVVRKSYLAGHAPSSQFRCHHCSQNFSSTSALRMHISKSHQADNLPHCCWECTAMFGSGPELIVHLNNTHEQLKQNGRFRFYQGRVMYRKK